MLRLATAVRTSRAQVIASALDAGSGAATLKVYTGAQPATPETAASGTLLATIALADPAASVASGVLTLDCDPVPSAVAVATGTAGWGRVADSAGVAVFDGSVGTSGTDFVIGSTTVATGDTMSLLSGSLTEA